LLAAAPKLAGDKNPQPTAKSIMTMEITYTELSFFSFALTLLPPLLSDGGRSTFDFSPKWFKLYLHGKYSLFLDVRLQSIKRHADAMIAQFPFVFRREVRIAQGVRNCNARDDAVYTYGLCNVNEVAYHYHGNARAFDFLCDR